MCFAMNRTFIYFARSLIKESEMIKNNLRIVVLTSVLVALTAFFTSCSCNCGKNNEENFVKGYITVVGNDPFTKLAVKSVDDKIYILQCSKELESLLSKDQGSFYYIIYSESRIEKDSTIIVVEKVLPLKNENKAK
jgi:hypothetical protein